jgi:small subunit ribosomal protein S18|uniref:Small ribosomal subunit protein bS18c n=1 Tax=Parietochloris pseudoalveolaris TaxID=3102 RepID=A0A097KLG9_9CHLO|nr:ribosomal protein S18 [Parietochloris pseudoalveolaris]AIT94039.1 ribosomal protein S18 [Parietochloris pseudoalveolaris]
MPIFQKTNTTYQKNRSGNQKGRKIAQKKRIIPVIPQKSKPKLQGTIEFKNVVLLRDYITSEGKILPRRMSGLTSKQQRYMARAIKNARMLALLPFTSQQSEK